MTQLFDGYSKDHFSSTVSELLDHGEFPIKDPLRGPEASAQDHEALYDKHLQNVILPTTVIPPSRAKDSLFNFRPILRSHSPPEI